MREEANTADETLKSFEERFWSGEALSEWELSIAIDIDIAMRDGENERFHQPI